MRTFFQNLQQKPFGCSRIGCGLQYDNGTLSKIFGDVLCNISDVTQIWLLMHIERSWYANGNEINFTHEREVIRSTKHPRFNQFR